VTANAEIGGGILRTPLLSPAFVLREGKRVVVMRVQALFDGHGNGGRAVRGGKGESV
jgi:hypothetical protein